jgi:hypothetical protein
MKTKKYGVFVVLSAALLITALIASCTSPVDTDLQTPRGSPKIPAGMARIQVKVDNSARTILPNTTVTSYSVYAHTTSALGTAIGTGSSTTIAATVAPGTYTITVLGSNTTGIIVQGSTASPVTVASGTNTDVPITLSVIDDDGTGTFSWTITPPGGGATAVSLTPLSGGTSGVSGGASGSESLASGYYRVAVTFTQTGYQTLIFQEDLHVYQNTTSTYTLDYSTITMVSNLHTITLNANGGTLAGGINTIADILHATVAAAPTSPTPPSAGQAFNGWFTTATGSTKWDFTPVTGTKVLKNITLYAQYLAAASFNVVVTFNAPSEATWTGISTIPLADTDTSPTNVALAGGGFDDINWYLDGFPTALGSGTTLSLDWNDLILLVPPGNSYKLYVTATVSGIPYSSPLASSPTVIIP